MGAGESVYVQKQEAFVRANRDEFLNKLNNNGGNYRYSKLEVEGKLRQLYAGTDTQKKNEWTYINPQNWNYVKSNINIKYPTNKYYY